jgi:small subunit ribosomal protein S6
MNHYETVYIIHPAIQEGRLNDIVSKFKTKIESHKGEFFYVENWGKKKLSYPIDKQKYGTYIMCQYSLNGEIVKNISQDLELNPNILRYLVTKIEKEDIKEGANTLDHIEEKNTSKPTKSEPKLKEVKKEPKVEEEIKEESKEEEVKEESKAEEVKEEPAVEDNSSNGNNEETSDTEKEGEK